LDWDKVSVHFTLNNNNPQYSVATNINLVAAALKKAKYFLMVTRPKNDQPLERVQVEEDYETDEHKGE